MSEAPILPHRQAELLWWLLVLASILLAIGLVSPMLTLTRFVFFEDSFSVLSGIVELFKTGRYGLFVIIALFSIVLPVLKIAVLFRLVGNQAESPQQVKRYLHLMHEYGRWSMLDVLVVAILIVTVKLGAIASIEIHAGLYVFGAAVLLIMFITQRVVKLTDDSDS